MDAHVHGHDGALRLGGYAFAEVTLGALDLEESLAFLKVIPKRNYKFLESWGTRALQALSP